MSDRDKKKIKTQIIKHLKEIDRYTKEVDDSLIDQFIFKLELMENAKAVLPNEGKC